MRSKVIIKPYGTNGQMLPGIYHINGKIRVLLSEYTYKEYDAYDYEKEKPKELTYTFSKSTMPTKEYEYEKDPTLQTPRDKEIDALVTIFWGQHPQFTINGKSDQRYTKTPNFDLVDMVDKSIATYSVWSNKLSVANKINEMSLDSKRDVAYFFGSSPVGKTEKDLAVILADFSKGVCMNENIVSGTKSNLDLFLSVWMKETDEERSYVVNTRKAITMGIFLNNQADGRDNYYYGQTFVGNTFNDVLAFCKREGRIYKENIIREIDARQARLDKKATPVNVPIAPRGVAGKAAIEEIEGARAELRQLIKDGHVAPMKGMHLLNIDSLKEAVDQGRKKKQAQPVA